MMNREAMLKPKEVAQWLGVHVNTVKRLSDRGDLPFFRIGTRGDRRYRPSDIESYLDGRGFHGNGATGQPQSGDARGSGES